jgi:hypothetical protein
MDDITQGARNNKGHRSAPAEGALSRDTAATASRRGGLTAPMVSVYDGRELAGFLLARGKLGFETFDRDERSLGIYPTQREAARALDEVPR